jgi:hypothetical protein
MGFGARPEQSSICRQDADFGTPQVVAAGPTEKRALVGTRDGGAATVELLPGHGIVGTGCHACRSWRRRAPFPLAEIGDEERELAAEARPVERGDRRREVPLSPSGPASAGSGRLGSSRWRDEGSTPAAGRASGGRPGVL